MKLHSDDIDPAFRVTAYGDGYVRIGEESLTANFVITPTALHRRVPIESLEALRWSSLTMLHDAEPEILLLGTGARQRFPAPEFHVDLGLRRIGLEVMSTPAACRTYNILLAEGRRVAALLLVESD